MSALRVVSKYATLTYPTYVLWTLLAFVVAIPLVCLAPIADGIKEAVRNVLSFVGNLEEGVRGIWSDLRPATWEWRRTEWWRE